MGNIWWLISTAWSQMDKRFATRDIFMIWRSQHKYLHRLHGFKQKCELNNCFTFWVLYLQGFLSICSYWI